MSFCCRRAETVESLSVESRSQHVLPEMHAFVQQIALHTELCVNVEVHVVSAGGWLPLHVQQSVRLRGWIPTRQSAISSVAGGYKHFGYKNSFYLQE